MADHMLTTTDNPYNPFTEFDQWQAYDTSTGHHTLAFLARVCITSNDLSELDQSMAIDMAIDEIVNENVNGLYTKVAEPETVSID